MAVATNPMQFRAKYATTMYDHDPDDTNANVVAWVDMRDYRAITFSFFRTVGTSDLTFEVVASDDSAGATNVTVVKTKTVDPDAVGDYVFDEVLAEEIAQVGSTASVTGLRYVGLRLTFATGTDEGVVTYIREAKHQQLDLTSDNIA